MDVWRERMRVHADSACVHLIVNERREAGASLPHTHAQLYALDFVPAAIARERERFGAYATQTMGGNLLADLVQQEVRRRERIVAIDDEAVLMSAYAGARAVPADDRAADAARALRGRRSDRAPRYSTTRCTRLARRLGASPPLNLWVRTAPRGRRAVLLADRHPAAADAPRRARARRRREPQHRRPRAGGRRAARRGMRALVQRVEPCLGRGRRRAHRRRSAPGCSCCSASRAMTPTADADWLADKVRALRIFADADGRMNEPLGDREVLCVSQFTLYGDARRGNRPSYVEAAPPRARRAAVRAVLRAARRQARACSVRYMARRARERRAGHAAAREPVSGSQAVGGRDA